MREKFRDIRFQKSTYALAEVLAGIVKEYTDEGYALTLRQLYYQGIARNVLPDDWIDVAYNRKHKLKDNTKNTVKNYKKLGTIVSDMRLAGLLDWNAIVDRGREPHKHIEFEGVKHRIESACENYRLPRWKDQPWYVELWVEKDALAGVLEPICDEFHITLMVNKGYSSQSAMYASAKRFNAARIFASGTKEKALRTLFGKAGADTVLGTNRGSMPRCVLFYLGDFDPSGEDMVRDIRDRLTLFGASHVQVRKIGLTREQIDSYEDLHGRELPPNPAKFNDPRAGVDEDGNITNADGYVARHGNNSWEVDALDLPVLHQIVRDALESVTDQKKIEAWKRRELRDIGEIHKACEHLIREGISTPDPPPKKRASSRPRARKPK